MLSFLLAAAVSLGWNPSEGAVHYRVHVGIQSMAAGSPPLVSYSTDDTEFRVTGLDYRTSYFFVATAINAQGLESGYSNEVQYTPMPGRR